MNSIKISFQKILSFLRLRSIAGGLEISDQVLRLVYFNGKTWQMAAIRLAPGVMDKGKVQDRQALVTALQQLRLKIPFVKKKKMNVVVSLSSVKMYSQTFTLPIMEGEDLDKAIDLNVQMLSPIDIKQTYFGWQRLGRDETSLRLEIAAAFIDKALVDDITQVLYATGFITVGVESRALALVRILREKGAGIDVQKSYLLLDIDNSGIDFLIVRKGMLYFEYASLWNDIANDKGEVSIEAFKSTLAGDLRQVINFYSQHWPEPLAAVILSAVVFQDEAEKIVLESASLPVIKLTLVMGQPISSEWLVALGSSLREIQSSGKDADINLSGEDVIDIFRKEQFSSFMDFWRIVIPVILGSLVVIIALADNFLVTTRKDVESQAEFSDQQAIETQQIQALQASSTAFNQSVALIQGVESQLNGNYMIVSEVIALASANGIALNNISFQGVNAPILVAGSAPSETQIVAFKNAIQADVHFGTVTLPLSGIQPSNGGYMFSMMFPLSPQGFQ